MPRPPDGSWGLTFVILCEPRHSEISPLTGSENNLSSAFCSADELTHFIGLYAIIVVYTTLPMGVYMKGSRRRSRIYIHMESFARIFSLIYEFFFLPGIFIGCTTSAPDGSSPRGYGQILVLEHRLKTVSIDLNLFILIFLSGARPVLPMGVAPEALVGCMHQIIGSKNIYRVNTSSSFSKFLRIADISDDD